ncbi:hypothetical protein DFH09DRAFT_1323352 [Mycena vulgaris]|nr:hypothetical protein DFH09DRAFT_1323352 [Mycena vulgaris]
MVVRIILLAFLALAYAVVQAGPVGIAFPLDSANPDNWTRQDRRALPTALPRRGNLIE